MQHRWYYVVPFETAVISYKIANRERTIMWQLGPQAFLFHGLACNGGRIRGIVLPVKLSCPRVR